jgi:GT2 family glycosyltransferase
MALVTDRTEIRVAPCASVIVLGYGKEEYLEECLAALVSEVRPADELLLVDNGIQDAAIRLGRLPARVRVIGDGVNLGFAGGCNFAADHAAGEVLVFVNSDAIVRPGSLSRLVSASVVDGVGVAGGCLRLADAPDKVNSVGNPLQYLGVTWAGACGEPASDHTQPGEVAVATGGFFAVRRAVWDLLGGFDTIYFAYNEDTDLCLRAWLNGFRVGYVPDAIADHYYEFSRNPFKMYLVERNRLVTVLTDYPRGLLLAVLPMLLLFEPAVFVIALRQGWPRQKLSSWWWLLTHARTLRDRRERVQAGATVPAVSIAALMTGRIEPPMVEVPPGMGVLNLVLSGYWSLAQAAMRRFSGAPVVQKTR